MNIHSQTNATSSLKATDNIYIAHVSIPKNYLRALVPIVIGCWYFLDNHIREMMLSTMADAYINVGVFVAVTLFIYYGAERIFGFDITKLSARPAWQQISVASFLGALPGCGGAIIVVSQYASGHMGFASLVAVLVATMGDAAFLLLAKDPKIGLIVMALGLLMGVISGLVVNAMHSDSFLRQAVVDTESKTKRHLIKKGNNQDTVSTPKSCPTGLIPIPKAQTVIWMLLLLVAFPMTILSAFQVDVPSLQWLGYTIDMPIVVGAMASVLGVLMWALLPLKMSYQSMVAEDGVAFSAKNEKSEQNFPADGLTTQDMTVHTEKLPSRVAQIVSKVIHDTNFIMVWVIVAFLAFELFIYYTGISLEGLFNHSELSFMWWLAPLFGVLIGFLPGCGPQIIVASLYLQGIVPISTLLGNAISNDGDALFPAIALAPRAALLATLYSAIPALLVAYGVHWFL